MTDSILVAGIDIGSTYTKTVLLDETRTVRATAIRRSGYKPAAAAWALGVTFGFSAPGNVFFGWLGDKVRSRFALSMSLAAVAVAVGVSRRVDGVEAEVTRDRAGRAAAEPVAVRRQ